METDTDRPFVLLPYFHATSRHTIADFELIPWEDLQLSDCTDESVCQAALDLLSLYRIRAGRRGVGVFVRPEGSLIGDPDERVLFDDAAGVRFRLAALLGVLEGSIEEAASGGPQMPRSGQAVMTADNVFLARHVVNDGGLVAVGTGALVRTLNGMTLGDEDSVIHPPIELHIPTYLPSVDWEYATAAYECLGADTAVARRLAVATGWLDHAWKNTTSLSERQRILDLRAGFDAVLDTVDEKIEHVRPVLCSLLDPDGTPEIPRTYTTLSGNSKTEMMTDLGWWFTKFTHLRNSISHGDDVPQDAYVFETGERHFWIGERALRMAIKRTIAEQGQMWILATPQERRELRVRKALAELEESGTD